MKIIDNLQCTIYKIFKTKFFILLIIVFIFYTLHCTLYIPAALAVDSSPSAEIKDKLKALQTEIASRAAEMKTEVTKKLQNKFYIGGVKSKDSQTLSLATTTNTKNININEFTEYIIKSKGYVGSAGLKNIAIDNIVATLGDIDDKGTLNAKRIIKFATPLPAEKKVVSGIIVSTSSDSAKLQTAQKDQYLITFDKKTDYQMGKSASDFSDIKQNRRIIVVGEGLDEKLLAKFIYIFPYTLTVKTKLSTPSATPSATKTPIPKKTD